MDKTATFTTLYAFGRILGLFEFFMRLQKDEIKAFFINRYTEMPNSGFINLQKKYYSKLSGHKGFTNRLNVLVAEIDTNVVEELNKRGNFPIPIEDQGSVQLGYYHEQAFWAKPIGERIAEGREKIGLTPDELADKTGLEAGQITQYESGEEKPERAIREALREVLGYRYI